MAEPPSDSPRTSLHPISPPAVGAETDAKADIQKTAQSASVLGVGIGSALQRMRTVPKTKFSVDWVVSGLKNFFSVDNVRRKLASMTAESAIDREFNTLDREQQRDCLASLMDHLSQHTREPGIFRESVGKEQQEELNKSIVEKVKEGGDLTEILQGADPKAVAVTFKTLMGSYVQHGGLLNSDGYKALQIIGLPAVSITENMRSLLKGCRTPEDKTLLLGFFQFLAKLDEAHMEAKLVTKTEGKRPIHLNAEGIAITLAPRLVRPDKTEAATANDLINSLKVLITNNKELQSVEINDAQRRRDDAKKAYDAAFNTFEQYANVILSERRYANSSEGTLLRDRIQSEPFKMDEKTFEKTLQTQELQSPQKKIMRESFQQVIEAEKELQKAETALSQLQKE